MSTNTQASRIQQQATTTHDAQGFGNGENAIAGPCQLLKVVITNKSAGTLWLAFFNAATATGTPAITPIAIPATSTVVIDVSTTHGEGWCGVAFTTGLTWAASSAAVFNQDSSSSLWPTLTFLQ
jgi:hypothetical protein